MQEPPKDLLKEIYSFDQSNKAEFYELVAAILERSLCAIISKPYWQVVDGHPGADVFTLFPKLECPVCDGKFITSNITKFTRHAIKCLIKHNVLSEDHSIIENYEKYGVVPKSVKSVIDDARTRRDHEAVCISPVIDHPDIRGLADIQRKERERMVTQASESRYVKTSGPIGPVLKLAKGAEMPLDTFVWIQTPLCSELATLLLAGMQPVRHSSRGIHLPIQNKDLTVSRVIQLHVDRFEEMAAVRLAEQSWETMKMELQQAGLQNEVDMNGSPIVPVIPDVFTGDPKDSFIKIMNKTLQIERPKEILTQKMYTTKVINHNLKEKRLAEKARKERAAAVARAAKVAALEARNGSSPAGVPPSSSSSHSSSIRQSTPPSSMKAINGTPHSSPHFIDRSINDQPGCSKFM
ncbi:hypothetical protein PFISCL1PPCAC_14945 [Pristionchus fissidentatus]|uniref:Uncharacterized protein n=1 Tax=Pristionchus fissidentatus TaxID=1538716 RepID=A0AAV5VZ46_9BILA|nr:hypothetical protein PFISCL1PPCAC_14945 [Pristionchus fissidentatus]